ncbi:putative enzymatic polyprotein [Sesamum angolense]|uniref:Enzymatic polyprotein n=1 Tax=Sesamum angolense TaxID=2727404 RepID=A0AAE1X8N5_9LAMI|nr:putative enzymatic polyprotein [Sesamum angolense]
MRESADFHTNTTPTFVGTRLRENPGRNPRRAPENTPWARTMLQPLHPYGAVLNLDVIDFRNMEKLIDEWVAAIKIAATTLELDKENFIKLVELSLEGSVKIGWDIPQLILKPSGVAVDVAAPMFFAKICSPWREMLIQSYKVPEGQMDSVARRMSFLKDKLKDWCYQASLQKNMKRLRGTIKRTPLCCDNNDFSTIIGESGEPRKRRKHRSDLYSRNPRRTPFRRRSWWSKTKARTYKSGQRSGPTRASSQGSRRTDTRSTGRTPTKRTFRWAHTRTNESFKDCNCWTCGARGHIAPDCPQKRGEIIRKFEATDDILDAVYYGELNSHDEEDRLQTSESLSGFFSRMTVSNKTMERIMRQDSNLVHMMDLELEESLIPKEEILEELRKLMFDIHPRIAYNLADQDFSRVLTLHQDFKRKDLMKEGNRPYSITYRIAYALSNTHHSDLFLRKEYIEIPRIFKEFAKQPVIGRYEGMLEIAGHEFLVAGVAGRENGCMTLGLSFLEDHKPWGRKGSGICTAKPGVFPKEARETLPVIAGRDFSQKILILNTGIREAKILIGGAFGTPWFRVLRREKAFNRIMPINFRSKRGDFDAKLTNPKMQDKRKFGKVLLSFRQQGLIDRDSFYEESEEEIKNLREALVELKTMDISEESILSLENVKRLIQRNFSENPLAWWDRNKIEATLKIKEECKYEYVRYKPIQMNMEDKKDMQIIIKEHINLGLIEPGISAYSSPGFLIKMESESKKFTAFSTPQGQYIWNVLPMGLANAPQIFQRKMDNLFKDYFEFMFVYIDDILIASKNMKDHIKHLEIFSDACHKEGLVLSEKKATIAVNKIEFLGILIDEAGIELQEHIVEKIRNFPDVLKDKKQLQSFLGVVNFAGIFIKDLAKYRKDFRPLLKETESAKWKWEEIHTQRIRELKQVCNNLPKLAIPQDEDELVVYTDANDYRWAAVLMKKTTTGEEPCRYTGGFLDKMEGAEANSVMLRLRHLRENLEELDREFGRLAASPSVMTRELREQGSKPALRVQGSRPVAADSSTACTRPSSDSGETATDESQGVKTSDDSSQPSTSGVYQRMWEKLISRKGVNPSKTIIETTGKYNRVWIMEGTKHEEVREWYEFGALASVHTMSPSFPEISKLPEWISGAVYDSWQNNPHLKRGDILELKFISAAPEMAGKGSHPAFHFIKLQRPDMVAFNRIKATTEEAPLVSAFSEDDISTRRAWGLWVCLTEMDKVKYPFKNLLQQGEWIVPVKLHDRKEH